MKIDENHENSRKFTKIVCIELIFKKWRSKIKKIHPQWEYDYTP